MQWKDTLGFLEADSWFVKSLLTVSEGKQLAQMQLSGISEEKDCTLQLDVKRDEMIRCRGPCPIEE